MPNNIVSNDLQICARSGLTGEKWDIDYLSHAGCATGCVDNDGGVSCANAAALAAPGELGACNTSPGLTSYLRTPYP